VTQNLDDQQLQLAHLASADFLLFVDLAFADLYPGQVLATNWHLEVFAELARRIADGELRKLMVALPPRSLKSFIFSACLPAYLLGKNPGLRILCASYGMDLARQHSADCRKIMMSEWVSKNVSANQIERSEVHRDPLRDDRKWFPSCGLSGRVCYRAGRRRDHSRRPGERQRRPQRESAPRSNGLVFSLSAHAPQ
jgi:hypothetical protein